jgi:hypothetical protein
MTVFISLGYNCLPAAWGVYSKKRTKKKDGYKTCPFDLMVSSYKGIIKCINEDFKNFTNISFLTVDKNNLIHNTYYNFLFNHESPLKSHNLVKSERWKNGPNHFIENNFSKFILRYNTRIQNFKNYLNKNNVIFSICFSDKSQEKRCIENNCKELKDALKLKYPNLKYKIIIIEGKNHCDHLHKVKMLKILN